MSKWHDFISHEKNGIRRGLSASINALSGASNGLMNILFTLIWMYGCWGCIRLLLGSKAPGKKSVNSSGTKSFRLTKENLSFAKENTVGYILTKMQISTPKNMIVITFIMISNSRNIRDDLNASPCLYLKSIR